MHAPCTYTPRTHCKHVEIAHHVHTHHMQGLIKTENVVKLNYYNNILCLACIYTNLFNKYYNIVLYLLYCSDDEQISQYVYNIG